MELFFRGYFSPSCLIIQQNLAPFRQLDRATQHGEYCQFNYGHFVYGVILLKLIYSKKTGDRTVKRKSSKDARLDTVRYFYGNFRS